MLSTGRRHDGDKRHNDSDEDKRDEKKSTTTTTTTTMVATTTATVHTVDIATKSANKTAATIRTRHSAVDARRRRGRIADADGEQAGRSLHTHTMG